jgi:hypothetical protein
MVGGVCPGVPTKPALVTVGVEHDGPEFLLIFTGPTSEVGEVTTSTPGTHGL